MSEGRSTCLYRDLHILTLLTSLSCDLNLPKEIDDEYWDISEIHRHTPIQPSGRPALVVAFNHLVGVTQNVELVMNSIVSEDTLSS